MPHLDVREMINYPTANEIKEFASRNNISRRTVKICRICGSMHIGPNVHCTDCKKGNTYIDWKKAHNFKPSPRFYGKGKYYFGLELEVVNTHSMQLARKISSMHRREFYCKHDGSVDLEFVSHPLSYSYIQENWNSLFIPMMDKLVAANAKSWTGGKCGAHIHVSRTIGKLNIYKIASFFFRTENWRFLVAYSGRDSHTNRFCNYEYLPRNLTYWVNNGNSHSDRYIPLNLESKYTIEFRIFRGSLNKERIKMNFEFVNTMIEWVSVTSLKDINWMSFLAYIKDYNKPLFGFMTADRRMINFFANLSDIEVQNISQYEKTNNKFYVSELSEEI